MNLRHLATKSFDGGILYSKDLIDNNSRTLTHKGVLIDSSFSKASTDNTPTSLSYSEQISIGLTDVKNNILGDKIIDSHTNEVLPLSMLYGHRDIPSLLSSNSEDMIQTACKMFPNQNPNTGIKDVIPNKFYTRYIPLVVLTGCMTPQVKDDKTYFNPSGVVSIAEFLDGINAIKYGANSNRNRMKTLDKISNPDDYFNEGYQSCIRGISSPFFNLYTRKELLEPITRLELAYITVICWNQFLQKYNNIYGGIFYLGINFDWENPSDLLSCFEDGFDYKVSRCLRDLDYDIVSLNIKDYKPSDKSMFEYKQSIKDGTHCIPLPMFMSILELYKLDLFYFENSRLDPLKEVSRGELCYFLSRLAQLFPMNYINGDI